MTNLYELYMHNNEISAIEPFPFVNLPSLYYLYLQNNFIQSLESNTFVNMTNLNELHLTSNPINCDCSIYPFWSWLVERASIGTSAKCNDGRFVISLRSSALEKCNPDNCKCFNGGTCVTKETGLVICDCIGQWTGEFCQDSQCISHNCGFGDCFIEPMNGTAQCVFDDTKLVNNVICVSALVVDGGLNRHTINHVIYSCWFIKDPRAGSWQLVWSAFFIVETTKPKSVLFGYGYMTILSNTSKEVYVHRK
ncbi:ELFN2 [Mytilus edulis]|uniref:ELFN2 n=1 Tax=Mytilus edulis TaxID=6550 RepID=A0A8S3R8I1_MYTED|nr:ELFN2 [Mytilus edulis]